MSALRIGTRGPTLPDRLEALAEAADVADGRLDGAVVDRARAVVATGRERLALGQEVVVAAFAGGTGSGKSSLFNAVARAELSRTGAVRPVTGEAVAWAVGAADATTALLDWLDVRVRHLVDDAAGAPEGLVVIDLPDHDSVEAAHREVVDRFVDRVDVLVWVVDPGKYAQQELHVGYLRRLAEHARVLVVALNQVDLLAPEARSAILDDLRRLLRDAGLRAATVVATSAATGEGVDALRELLADHVRERRAVADRVAADIRTAGTALVAAAGEGDGRAGSGGSLDADRLGVALADAVGASARAARASTSYTTEARVKTRPPLTRGLLGGVTAVRRRLRRMPAITSVGAAPPASPPAVRHALLLAAERAAVGLPHPWPARLHAVADDAGAALPAVLTTAVDGIDPFPPPRGWWRAVAAVWTVAELATVAGLIWLTLLGVLAYLRLPEPPLPEVRPGVPWPSALTVGGGAAWLLAWLVRGRAVAVGAARWGRSHAGRLARVLAGIAQDRALAPLVAELDARRRILEAASRARR